METRETWRRRRRGTLLCSLLGREGARGSRPAQSIALPREEFGRPIGVEIRASGSCCLTLCWMTLAQDETPTGFGHGVDCQRVSRRTNPRARALHLFALGLRNSTRGSPWRGRSSGTRRSCCSTSPPAPWTLAASARSRRRAARPYHPDVPLLSFRSLGRVRASSRRLDACTLRDRSAARMAPFEHTTALDTTWTPCSASRPSSASSDLALRALACEHAR